MVEERTLSRNIMVESPALLLGLKASDVPDLMSAIDKVANEKSPDNVEACRETIIQLVKERAPRLLWLVLRQSFTQEELGNLQNYIKAAQKVINMPSNTTEELAKKRQRFGDIKIGRENFRSFIEASGGIVTFDQVREKYLQILRALIMDPEGFNRDQLSNLFSLVKSKSSKTSSPFSTSDVPPAA